MSQETVDFDTHGSGKKNKEDEPNFYHLVIKFTGCRPPHVNPFSLSGNKFWMNLIDQATRQSAAAGDVPIEWHFAEEGAANAMRAVFQTWEIDIEVFWTPMP